MDRPRKVSRWIEAAVVLAALAFATPGVAQSSTSICAPTEEFDVQLRSMMEIHLADAQSARLHSVCIHEETVCGLVNAKNAFGAYVGYRPFAYQTDGEIYIMPASREGGEELATALLVGQMCGEFLSIQD